MLKMTIDNEEVLSNNDISIKEEILSPSSTILNNVYPKEWEEDKDYVSRFYYPKDYSKLNIQNFSVQPEEAGTTIQVNENATLTDVDTTKESRVLRILGQTSQTGTPTPSSPIPVNVVSGDNEIKINGANPLDNSTIVKGRLDNGVIGYESDTTALTTTTNSVLFTTNTAYRGIVTDYIPIMASSYIYSVYDSADQTIGQALAFYDKDKNFISQLNGGSITNGKRYANNVSNAKYCRIWYYLPSAGTTTITDLQVRFSSGETSPTYEPYIGNSYPISLGDIELCKIGTYQDYIYKDNGSWYLHKEIGKVVLDGTQSIPLTNWRASSTSVGWVYAYNVFNAKTNASSLVGAIMSNKLNAQKFDDLFNKNVDNGIATYTNIDYGLAIRVGDTSLTTLNAINTYLSANPIVVYYALATPTNTLIEDTNLIEQLESLSS